MSRTVSEKPYKGLGMEGATARWYASLTYKSLEDFKALARRVAGEIAPQAHVLEVAPGPGYFAVELAKLGPYKVTGLDISRTFVEIARRNAFEAGVKADFRQGDAARMPFENESFDFLLCRAAFKNFSQPLGSLQEMYRVLKPGGRALIIDLRKDASRESLYAAVNRMHVGAVNAFLTKLTFRFLLLKRAYTKEEFQRLLSQTRFERVGVAEDLIGLELSLERAADR